MAKKKQQIAEKKIIKFLKKWWWLVVILLALAVWLLYSQIFNNNYEPKLNSTYLQVYSTYSSMKTSFPVKENNNNFLKKICRNIGSEIERNTECGTYIHFEAISTTDLNDFQSRLKGTLNDGDYSEINIIDSSDKTGGAAEFTSSSGIGCRAAWSRNGSENSISFNLYCREVVPDYLPGYTRQ